MKFVDKNDASKSMQAKQAATETCDTINFVSGPVENKLNSKHEMIWEIFRVLQFAHRYRLLRQSLSWTQTLRYCKSTGVF